MKHEFNTYRDYSKIRDDFWHPIRTIGFNEDHQRRSDFEFGLGFIIGIIITLPIWVITGLIYLGLFIGYLGSSLGYLLSLGYCKLLNPKDKNTYEIIKFVSSLFYLVFFSMYIGSVIFLYFEFNVGSELLKIYSYIKSLF